MRPLPCAAFVLSLLLSPAAAQAETWWKLGSTTENKGLYIDADSVSVDDEGYAAYRGMFVYSSTWTTDDGQQIRYEVFDAEIDCLMGELYEKSRVFYGDNRGFIARDDSGEFVDIESGKASAWEADFVCDSPDAWSGYGYYRVADPVADTRGW
ncbi:MAG TPA: hypothetical protein VF138_02000 [Caulobacteraceae bacterium]